MKISVLILFCDKDYKNSFNLIKNIKENLYLDYEIIVADNRNDKSEILKFDEDIKVLNFNYGSNVYRARYDTIMNSNGDYVWFVDGDDEILKINKDYDYLLNENSDCYIFNSLVSNDKPMDFDETDGFFTEQEDLFHYISGPLWNKWLKTSILKKSLLFLGDSWNFFSGDDGTILRCFSCFSSNCRKLKDCIYNYNASNSFINSRTEMTLDKYKFTIYGTSDMLKANQKIDSEFSTNFYSRVNFVYPIMFLKQLLFVRLKDLKQAIEVYEKEFNFESIVVAWKQIIYNDYENIDLRKFTFVSMILGNHFGYKNFLNEGELNERI